MVVASFRGKIYFEEIMKEVKAKVCGVHVLWIQVGLYNNNIFLTE